ncbi:hypothetical protein SCA6_010109 [Theobroma cacao]
MSKVLYSSTFLEKTIALLMDLPKQLLCDQVFIAYLGSLPEGEYFPSSHHSSMLQAVLKQRMCQIGCLKSSLVKGKLVLCDEFSGHEEARDAGALGSIVPTSLVNVSFVVPFPTSALENDDYGSVKSYLNSIEYVDF